MRDDRLKALRQADELDAEAHALERRAAEEGALSSAGQSVVFEQQQAQQEQAKPDSDKESG